MKKISTSMAGIALATVTTIFSGCGSSGKGKETPAPSQSDDANVGSRGAAGAPGAAGQKGDKGDRGSIGPGSEFPYILADANGSSIGDTTWDGFAKFSQGALFSFQTLDGAIFTVNPMTGLYAGGAYCLYAANDCSGSCLFPASPGSSNQLVQGTSSFFWLKNPTARTQQSYSSYSVDNDAGGTTCVVAGGPAQEWLVEVPTAWTQPQGFSYPIPVPLALTKTLAK